MRGNRSSMQDNKSISARFAPYASWGLLIAAALWGSSFPIGKLCLEYLPPVFMVAVRCIASGLILLPFCLKKLRTLPKRDLLLCAFLGVLFTAAYGCQIIGLKYTASATQSFVAALYIVFVPFFLWLINRRRPTWFDVASVVLALAGLYLLTVQGVAGFTKGDALTIASAVIYAVHIILIAKATKTVDPITINAVQFIVAGVLSAPFVPFFGGFPKEVSAISLLGFAYIILVCTVGAYILQIFGQTYTEENRATILMSLESVFGALLSVVLLKDRFSPIMIVGCFLVFLAVITTQTKWAFLFKRKAPTSADTEMNQ